MSNMAAQGSKYLYFMLIISTSFQKSVYRILDTVFFVND